MVCTWCASICNVVQRHGTVSVEVIYMHVLMVRLMLRLHRSTVVTPTCVRFFAPFFVAEDGVMCRLYIEVG